jgi:hypothetical protein
MKAAWRQASFHGDSRLASTANTTIFTDGSTFILCALPIGTAAVELWGKLTPSLSFYADTFSKDGAA